MILGLFGTLPIRGTEVAGHWDAFYTFLVVLSAVFFIGILIAMILFAVKYNRQRRQKAEYIESNHLLEILWTVIPTVLVMVIFVWGYVVYREMVQYPSDAYEIRVIAKQWLWQFQYETGRTEVNQLYVPVNKPVKLIMTSDDVIHSFFVPNFRIKKDVVPGMYTHVWFQATVPGEHHLFCAEYCGTSHSGMLGKVIALEEPQWKDFLRGKTIVLPSGSTAQASAPMQTLAERGRELTKQKGCVACHNDTGVGGGVGPTYRGLYGSTVELADGSKVVADDNYIRESIEAPTAKVVKGYNPVMPTFKGLLKEEDINAIIAYLKSVK